MPTDSQPWHKRWNHETHSICWLRFTAEGFFFVFMTFHDSIFRHFTQHENSASRSLVGVNRRSAWQQFWDVNTRMAGWTTPEPNVVVSKAAGTRESYGPLVYQCLESTWINWPIQVAVSSFWDTKIFRALPWRYQKKCRFVRWSLGQSRRWWQWVKFGF